MMQAAPHPQQQPANDTVYISFSAEVNAHTAETLIGACGDLVNKGTKKIYLLMSTPGGSCMHGLNIYNVLRALPVKLVIHNVGNIDSIGNVIFLAADERYCCPHTTFMFHGVGFDTTGAMRLEEKFLKERMDGIAAEHARIGKILAERTKITPNEVETLFLQAVTKDADFALSKGIVQSIADVKIPAGSPFFQLVFQR